MSKDTEFYSKESASYSAKRYPERPTTFVQFFFTRRLKLALDMLDPLLSDRSPANLLEVGCADGVVIRAIDKRFRRNLRSVEGIDLSESMVDIARRQAGDVFATFSVRKPGAPLPSKKDFIIEIGVLNYTDLDSELEFVRAALPSEGRYLCSVAGSSSAMNLMRPYGSAALHLRSYGHYEQAFSGKFSIERTVPVGLFIPFLWKFPFAAAVQRTLEALLRVFPSLAVEKLYLLKPRT